MTVTLTAGEQRQLNIALTPISITPQPPGEEYLAVVPHNSYELAIGKLNVPSYVGQGFTIYFKLIKQPYDQKIFITEPNCIPITLSVTRPDGSVYTDTKRIPDINYSGFHSLDYTPQVPGTYEVTLGAYQTDFTVIALLTGCIFYPTGFNLIYDSRPYCLENLQGMGGTSPLFAPLLKDIGYNIDINPLGIDLACTSFWDTDLPRRAEIIFSASGSKSKITGSGSPKINFKLKLIPPELYSQATIHEVVKGADYPSWDAYWPERHYKYIWGYPNTNYRTLYAYPACVLLSEYESSSRRRTRMGETYSVAKQYFRTYHRYTTSPTPNWIPDLEYVREGVNVGDRYEVVVQSFVNYPTPDRYPGSISYEFKYWHIGYVTIG